MTDSYLAAIERLADQQVHDAKLLAEALALLRDVEWNGDEVHHVCICCGRMRMHGHDADCRLRRVLSSQK